MEEIIDVSDVNFNVVDKEYRDIIATKIDVTDIIPKSVYSRKNKDKSWAYKKYPEFDKNFICISKDGTLGEIWRVGGLLLGMPSSEGKEILNIDVSSDDAVWNRTKIPKDFILLERTYRRDMRQTKGIKRNGIRKKYVEDREVLIDKHQDFVNKEFHRRKYGLFVKIDEDIIYITGENYMFLNYYYLTEDKIYPNFRITATHTWWHWEGVVADKDSWGELRLKSRRVAWTVEACSIALNTFSRMTYAEIPVVSETDRLAGKLFASKIVNPFKYYPTYFIPLIEKPNDKSTTKLEITFETDEQEISNISVYPTKDVAYDSTKALFGINDEVGKYTNTTFTTFRGNHRDCYFKGLTKVVGKGKFGSTAGSFANGGESFKYEFENADPLDRDKLGRTKTGLVALFVDDCYTSAGFFDKWGYPIVYDPKQPILNENNEYVEFGSITIWNMTSDEKKKGKKSDYNNYLRQHPRTPEHAFRDEGGVNNDFDIDNLNDHYDYLNALSDGQKSEIIFRGNLEWKGEPYNSDVVWIPNTKGRIKTTWIPETKLQNKYMMANFHGKKVKSPSNSYIGAFGVDSYDMLGNTKDGNGSDGAIVGYSKFNMTGAPTNSFFLIYKERPKKRDDFYDDVIKICQFFGMYALVESNKARLLEYMYDNGYTGYSLRRPDKKWKDLNDQEKLWGGIPSSKEVIGDQASGLQDYILDYIGQNLDKDCKVYFIELISEWIKFNINKRKEFDLGVASGMAKMGAQYLPPKRKYFEGVNTNSVSLSSFSA